MLVEFSISNFRSIRDRQVLSFVASADKTHEESNVVKDVAPGVERLLKCAVVYGANAAGKSNLLLGLDLLRDMVVESSADAGKSGRAKIKPYKLDHHAREPSFFEIVFVAESVKYQYGVLVNSTRVVEEWLYAFPEKRAQLWFYRTFDDDLHEYEWKFGPSLKGPKRVWSNSTKDGALFLSVAGQLKSEQLQPVYDWFDENLRVLLSGELLPAFSKSMLGDAAFHDRIEDFLKSCDIDFSSLGTREKAVDETRLELVRKMAPKESVDEIIEHLIMSESVEVLWGKTSITGESVWFAHDEESRGTQKLFGFAGPILDTLDSGYVMVVDELNNSMHPLMARRIIGMINDPVMNRSNAQMLVVTHETAMLDLDLLRRDQIWFVEKNNSATEVYPLSDFKPRKDASLERGYLQGRYGAVPYFGSGEL